MEPNKPEKLNKPKKPDKRDKPDKPKKPNRLNRPDRSGIASLVGIAVSSRQRSQGAEQLWGFQGNAPDVSFTCLLADRRLWI